MLVSIFMNDRKGYYQASGVYEDGIVTVKKGSRIRLDFAKHIRGGTFAKSYRNDPSIVDMNGLVMIDCVFKSPSTAAQFVSGRSSNGYYAWRTSKHLLLGVILGRYPNNKRE